MVSKNITLVFSTLSSLPFRCRSDMCISSFGVREHQVRSDTGRPRKEFHLSTSHPVVCDSSIRKLHSQLMYQVSHKDQKKGRA